MRNESDSVMEIGCVCRVGKNEAESGAIGCRMMQCLRCEMGCASKPWASRNRLNQFSRFFAARTNNACMGRVLLHKSASFTMAAPETACEPRY